MQGSSPQSLGAVVGVILLGVIGACTRTDAPREGPAKKYTPGTVAVRELNSQISGRIAALAQGGDGAEHRPVLVELLFTRARFLGTTDDLVKSLALSKAELDARPTAPEALALRARVLGTVHRFDEAITLLHKAGSLKRERGVDTAALDASLAGLRIAKGDSPGEQLSLLEKSLRGRKDDAALTALANGYAAVGKFDAADRLYEDSISAYRDDSPFPVAWVAFQRGLMWAELAGQPRDAIPHYMTAVSLLPGFVRAQVHLAEIERDVVGDEEFALRRLRSVGPENVQDPRAAGLVAEIVAKPDPPYAARLRAYAKERYDDLLTQLPGAFEDRAVEFYLEEGDDPKKAWALAQANLKVHIPQRARILAIEAALAAGEVAAACTQRRVLAETPSPLPVTTAALEGSKAACSSPVPAE